MTEPEDPRITEAPDHNVPDGPLLGWSAADFGPDDYVGDEQTSGLELVADGTQTDEPDDA